MTGRGPGPPDDPGRVIYIGVGSNVEPRRNIPRGVALLGARLRLTAASSFYQNPALHPDLPPHSLPPFINGVLRARTSLAPNRLAERLLRPVEAACGRVRTRDPNAPRPLDLDLLAVEGLWARTGALQLPDPDIVRYPFLAVPLAQLAPHLVPVGSERPVGEIARGMRVDGFQEDASLTRTIRALIAGMAGAGAGAGVQGRGRAGRGRRAGDRDAPG